MYLSCKIKKNSKPRLSKQITNLPLMEPELISISNPIIEIVEKRDMITVFCSSLCLRMPNFDNLHIRIQTISSHLGQAHE